MALVTIHTSDAVCAIQRLYIAERDVRDQPIYDWETWAFCIDREEAEAVAEQWRFESGRTFRVIPAAEAL